MKRTSVLVLSLLLVQVGPAAAQCPNVGGIVAGCIFGTLAVVGVALAIAALIWWKRKQKNKEGANKNQPAGGKHAYDNPMFEGEDRPDGARKSVGATAKVNGDASDAEKGFGGYVMCVEYQSPERDKTQKGSPVKSGSVQKNQNHKSSVARESPVHKSLSRGSLDNSFPDMDPEVISVSLQSQDIIGLGFNICGSMRDGIFISKLHNRGPAIECGLIKPGDRILEVSISFENMVYEDALTILSYASPYPVKLHIQKASPLTPLTQRREEEPTNALHHPVYRSLSMDDLSKIGKDSWMIKHHRAQSEMKRGGSLGKGNNGGKAGQLRKWAGTADIVDDIPESAVDTESPFTIPDMKISTSDLHMDMSDYESREEVVVHHQDSGEVIGGDVVSHGGVDVLEARGRSLSVDYVDDDKSMKRKSDLEKVPALPEEPPPAKKSWDSNDEVKEKSKNLLDPYQELTEEDKLDVIRLSYEEPSEASIEASDFSLLKKSVELDGDEEITETTTKVTTKTKRSPDLGLRAKLGMGPENSGSGSGSGSDESEEALKPSIETRRVKMGTKLDSNKHSEVETRLEMPMKYTAPLPSQERSYKTDAQTISADRKPNFVDVDLSGDGAGDSDERQSSGSITVDKYILPSERRLSGAGRRTSLEDFATSLKANVTPNSGAMMMKEEPDIPVENLGSVDEKISNREVDEDEGHASLADYFSSSHVSKFGLSSGTDSPPPSYTPGYQKTVTVTTTQESDGHVTKTETVKQVTTDGETEVTVSTTEVELAPKSDLEGDFTMSEMTHESLMAYLREKSLTDLADDEKEASPPSLSSHSDHSSRPESPAAQATDTNIQETEVTDSKASESDSPAIQRRSGGGVSYDITAQDFKKLPDEIPEPERGEPKGGVAFYVRMDPMEGGFSAMPAQPVYHGDVDTDSTTPDLIHREQKVTLVTDKTTSSQIESTSDSNHLEESEADTVMAELVRPDTSLESSGPSVTHNVASTLTVKVNPDTATNGRGDSLETSPEGSPVKTSEPVIKGSETVVHTEKVTVFKTEEVGQGAYTVTVSPSSAGTYDIDDSEA